MARFQVVAVYPSGSRFPVRAPHDCWLWAEWHRQACERELERDVPRRGAWRYEIDGVFVGPDGSEFERLNVQGDELGYDPVEYADRTL